MTRIVLLCLFVVISLAFAADSNLKDLGAPDFSCDASLMKKSKSVPTSVHSLRPADIQIVGALGDSLTAGNGADAYPHDVLGVMIEYRGLTFSVGGDKGLEGHVTIANVLRKFNPDLFGYSTGTGSAEVWENAKLNNGIAGAVSGGLVRQANDLIGKMKEHNIDINQWKAIFIFIGGNDICEWCRFPTKESADSFGSNIQAAVQVLKDNLPNTIVILTGMLDISILRQIDHDKYFCESLHYFECPCEGERKKISASDLQQECRNYMAAEQQIQDSGVFDTTDDFTFIIQPFFEQTETPPLLPDGEPDLSYFAPDCFHFSQFGHAVVAKNLWNNILQPVDEKLKVANLTDYSIPLICPDPACPFIRTTKNSQDCSKYMTPSA